MPVRLELLSLEPRDVPAVLAALAGDALTVTGTGGADRIDVFRDGLDIVVRDRGAEVGRFAAASVDRLTINAGAGDDLVQVSSDVVVPTAIDGGTGRDKLRGGGGTNTITGAADGDVVTGGTGANALTGGGGADKLYRVRPTDTADPGPDGQVLLENDAPEDAPQQTLTAADVDALLKRAAAASASRDGIIAVVDRNGRLLGVRVESGVATEITSNNANLVFAIDGAVAKARTGAFFGNNQAPLTSRTVQFISQSTITQREVDSNPNVTDPNSTLRGPGFVAPVGIKGHFPPNVANTPQVDLFGIEHTNRDGTVHPGADHIKGTADDVTLAERFNIDPAFVPPGQDLFPPDSFGFESGLLKNAQSRGIATLPGGIPIYKNGQEVGGIGVFYPGKTGFATEENSQLSTTFDPTKPDRSLEAEWVAFAALGGVADLPVGDLGGMALPAGMTGLPNGRIDLVGITLDIFGPGGAMGLDVLNGVGAAVGRGDANDGTNPAVDADANDDGVANDPVAMRDGKPVPEGWLVAPHDGVGISAAEVTKIITDGIAQANDTRAAIRLPLGSRTKMVFAVTDMNGDVVGLYRMPDATVFSIDVAVAKARNVAYYADPTQLQPQDQLPGVDAGTAFTNRTFRYLAHPRYPISVEGTAPGLFSQLNDGGADPTTGLFNGAPLPASAYQSVYGYDSFNPGTNFRQKGNVLNQNGIVFFPGSAPVYRGAALVGGFGVSGDGVDQDDVVTASGAVSVPVPGTVLRADQVVFRGVRLPYQKGNRNPED